MRSLLSLSLLLNVAVLVPVCVGLGTDARWTRSAFGPRSPARAILLSIYLAIGVASLLLLVAVRAPQAALALLGVQVLYKLTTPFTVGTLRNPVVRSNLAIAAVHATTVALSGVSSR